MLSFEPHLGSIPPVGPPLPPPVASTCAAALVGRGGEARVKQSMDRANAAAAARGAPFGRRHQLSNAKVHRPSPVCCDMSLSKASPHCSLPDMATFEYDDPFLGRRVRVCVAQLRQVDAPLQLMQLLLRLQLPRGRSSRADVLRPSPPLCHMQAALWPAQRARAMPGFTALLSRRLSTAPASLKVYFRSAAGWKAFIFSRVISGHVSRLQVLLLPCETASCLCLLTRAAALSGSMRADLAWRRQQLRHAPAPRLLTPPVFRRRLLLLASSASAASSKLLKTATLLSRLIMLWPIPLALA